MNIAVLKLLLEATLMTIRLFLTTLVCAIPLGLVVSAMRMSKHWILNIPARIFVTVLRGTPLMLQILFIFYGPGLVEAIPFSWNGNRILAAIVALVLNYSAYYCEIFRGGIEGVSVGQREAGKVLGLSKKQTFFIIVMPQVVKRVLPPLSNEIASLVKDTSLVQVLGITELMIRAKNQASGHTSILPYLAAMLIYLVINSIVLFIMGRFEKKLNYYR